MTEPAQHTIDGHQVAISEGAIFIDGVQATLNRTDVDVTQVLARFFEHLRAESAPTASLARTRDREPDAEQVRLLPELNVAEAPPGTTIVINITR